MWRGALAGWMVLLAGAQGCAAVRPAVRFSDLPARLGRGSTVYVTDAGGRETKGKVDDVSPAALTLEVDGTRQVISAATIQKIERDGDSPWNGIAIGAGIGAAAALISDPQYRPCRNDPAARCANAQIPQRLLFVGAMGVGGAGVDALYRRRHLVYLVPRAYAEDATDDIRRRP
jgi:hypothetical protein